MISLTAAILLRTDQPSGLDQKPFKATATRALEADQSLCNLLESIKCTYERNTERKGYGRGRGGEGLLNWNVALMSSISSGQIEFLHLDPCKSLQVP
jgi:hypothetical protein